MHSPGSRPFWLSIIEKNMPEVIMRLELSVLFRMTAASCGCKAPSMHGMDSGERLKLFRRFTLDAVKTCRKEALPSLRKEMYRRAFRIGRCLSFLPGLGDWKNRKRLIAVLYRNIGIQVRNAGDESRKKGTWHIGIPYCSFSSEYTPGICYVMSGMDAGIICGLLGGGKLVFTQRITEGCPYCTAFYQK